MVYETPANLVQLLDDVVGAAGRTSFYRPILPGRPRINNLEDFFALPITPLSKLREQPLAEVVTDPARVQWIAGAYKGQRRLEVAVAEGTGETGNRYELFRDALRDAAPGRHLRACAVIAAPEKRYFAAEVSAILGYLGTPAHVFTHHGNRRAYEWLHQIKPDLLVILFDGVDEAALPSGVELCMTFRRSQKLERLPQLDIYVVDELGFLGHSRDLRRWILYNDQYYFERSANNRLIVTALYNHTQPMLRVETLDTVRSLAEHDVELQDLSPRG